MIHPLNILYTVYSPESRTRIIELFMFYESCLETCLALSKYAMQTFLFIKSFCRALMCDQVSDKIRDEMLDEMRDQMHKNATKKCLLNFIIPLSCIDIAM